MLVTAGQPVRGMGGPITLCEGPGPSSTMLGTLAFRTNMFPALFMAIAFGLVEVPLLLLSYVKTGVWGTGVAGLVFGLRLPMLKTTRFDPVPLGEAVSSVATTCNVLLMATPYVFPERLWPVELSTN